MIDASDREALWLTLQLAAVSTGVLLLLCTPLAWWLSRRGGRLRALVEALVALPLVLPPTVIGFYLLIALAPASPLGQAAEALGLGPLVFSFGGLVIGSVIYSLPFVVQPLRDAFAGLDRGLLESAAALGAGPWQRFARVALPVAAPGYLTAAVLAFAHTLGEFGVVLMIGGNLPGETRVLSIAVYDRVESLDYAAAHALSATVLVLSFALLLLVYGLGRGPRLVSR